MNADIRVSDDPAQEAAELLAAASGHVAITGGSTPRIAYERAAELREDWSGVDFWFTDERCVPPEHEHSNFGMADRALLSRAEGATVHRMRGELGPEDGATAYENELGEFGPERARPDPARRGARRAHLLAVPGRRRPRRARAARGRGRDPRNGAAGVADHAYAPRGERKQADLLPGDR